MFFKIIYKLSRKIPGVSRVMKILYGCDIPRKTTIGKNVRFPHDGLGVVIHPNTVIGDNVTIQHHVTFGVNGFGNGDSPVVHDNVVLQPYSIIAGGIDIGENSVIGAGSVVLHDIPANTVFFNKREEFSRPRNERDYKK